MDTEDEYEDEYEGNDFSASDAAWTSNAEDNDTNKELKPPRYLDLRSLRIQNVGQKILDSALSSAELGFNR
jgi:hypothetical protein